MLEELKKCTKCSQVKPVSEYYYHSRNKRLVAHCKACHRLYPKVRTKRLRDDPVQWANALKAQAKYRAKNREKVRAWENKAYRERPSLKEYRKRWNREHKERLRELKARANDTRRARKLQAQGAHTIREWKRVCLRYGNKCLVCENPKVTKDHVIPYAKGGTNYASNLQPLCHRCNSSKKDRTFDYRVEYHLDW